MKKIIALFLVFMMLLSLAACGSEKNTTTVENNPGGNNPGGNNPGGNNPGGSSSQEGVLATLGDNYKIDLTYSAERYGDPITEHEVFMAGDGAYLYTYFDSESDAERTILVKNGHYYSYNEYAGFFGGCSTEGIEERIEDYDGWTKLIIISENAQKIEFTGQEATTFLNRPCTKYINKKHVDNEFFNDYDVDAYYIVDNATKLCLKYENTTKYYDDQDAISGEGTESFEVTEFAVGSVNMSSTLAKIKFDEWVNSEYLTSRGLTNVTAPNGIFADYSLSCDEDEKIIQSYSGTYVMTEANVNALCSAFYNAGVKYGYDNYTTVKPIEEIYRESTDMDGNPVDGYISFDGYTSTGAWVNIYAEIQEDGTYTVEISL